jgi:hypothetical protein
VLRSEDRLFAVDSLLAEVRRPPEPEQLRLPHVTRADVAEPVD